MMKIKRGKKKKRRRRRKKKKQTKKRVFPHVQKSILPGVWTCSSYDEVLRCVFKLQGE